MPGVYSLSQFFLDLWLPAASSGGARYLAEWKGRHVRNTRGL